MAASAPAAGESIDMSKEMHARIIGTLKDIDNGFKKVMVMYMITFYVGIGLILVACVGSLLAAGREFTLLSGSIGVIDVVAFLIFKPAESLQQSRGTLAQLISAFLTWYSDSKNSMQIYKKEMRRESDSINLYEKVSKRNVLNTISLMQAIQQISGPVRPGRNGRQKLDDLLTAMQQRTGD